ncbi:Adaptin N terminal region family protein [Histomonas meleagridis]|uniref:Adaptin N terminal region family protein n=1 Tax=Histomonas meleagridis TaxID=135588 RepID=UPI0035599B99|nr:Adaptin N terminal region family protein [Histomonas meleagridis]KAH0800285.1 Adaptin N terminal region family protein [Histomonas meleagridis]
MENQRLREKVVKDELLQLRENLDSNDPVLRKKAAKSVVSLMRSGENVGNLFSSMLRCVKTDDIELKRLVYHYIVTYSSQESEQSIMVVNTFIQDMEDFNPFIRALSIRTMSRIQIESVAESMIIPLKKCLHDKDPFVRKTASLAVAKLNDIIPEAVENSELFPQLINLLADDNPLVISNTLAAIFEINSKRSESIFELTNTNINIILNSLTSNCNEWCRTILFDSLAQYEPTDSKEATMIIERLLPFLKSSNASVIVSSFKCIYLFIEQSDKSTKELFPIILPPLITLINSSEPEIQYIILRTFSLFSQKYPKALSKEIRIFFCKYNDPSYIKMEKLDIIITNCNVKNVNIILSELIEYCNEIDVKFVRKSIKCIGQIAMKIPQVNNKCVDILIKIVNGKADYAIEEAIIILTELLRKFPGKFESTISIICKNINQLKDANARQSLIWILGEYSKLIDNVDVLIDPFLDNFNDEPFNVQLQIITTIVKIYISKPNETSDQLQYVLNEATKENILPDVRNRAMIYWRLLTIGNEITKKIMNIPKEGIDNSPVQFSDDILIELLQNMGTTSGVLHIIPSSFNNHQTKHKIDGISIETKNWKPLPIRNNITFLQLNGYWDPECYYLQIISTSEVKLCNFALAVKNNASKFDVSSALNFPEFLEPNGQLEVRVPFNFAGEIDPNTSAVYLDFALRTSLGIVYFSDFIDFHQITVDIEMKRKDYLKIWKDCEYVYTFKMNNSGFAAEKELKKRKICVVAKRDGEMCLAFAFYGGRVYIVDAEFDGNQVKVTLKGDEVMFKFIEESAQYAFCNE